MKLMKVSLPAIAFALAANVAIADFNPAGPEFRPERGGAGGPGARGERRDPAARLANRFDRMDADDSGAVTIDEFLAMPLERADRRFDRADSDDDGLISLAEFTDRPERTRNPDIDPEEVRACVEAELGEALPERPDRETVFAELDTSGDGFLDQAEATAGATSRLTVKFNDLDADSDGGVTEAELEASVEAHSELRQIRRACVEELQVAIAVAG